MRVIVAIGWCERCRNPIYQTVGDGLTTQRCACERKPLSGQRLYPDGLRPEEAARW